MNVKLAAVFCIPFCLLTAVVDAHSVALRLGAFAPRIESDLWEENLATFTIERSDFDALIGGIEVSIELSELVDLTFGVETSSSTVFSNYRDFVFEDGSEILQDLTLRTTPVTAGVYLFPIGKLHRVFPYVTGGAGFYVYGVPGGRGVRRFRHVRHRGRSIHRPRARVRRLFRRWRRSRVERARVRVRRVPSPLGARNPRGRLPRLRRFRSESEPSELRRQPSVLTFAKLLL